MSETTRISASTLARRIGPDLSGGGQPAYRTLADRIRAAVLDGRLAVSTGLPSERDLATWLALSRTTVGAAYALLREQGWLDSRRGSGSRLRLPPAEVVTGGARSSARPTVTPFGPGGIFGWQEGVGWHDVGPTGRAAADGVIDLTTASLPAPAEPLAAAVAAAAEMLPRYMGGDGYLP